MANTYTHVLYHVVFSTKNREPLIRNSLKPELHKFLGGLIRDKKGILLEVGGMADHVHLVIKLRPDTSISDVVKYIKANSSGWVNDRPDQRGDFYWQRGYAAFTVSESQLRHDDASLRDSSFARTSPAGSGDSPTRPGRRLRPRGVAACTGPQVSERGSRMALAVRIPSRTPVAKSKKRGTRPTSHRRIPGSEGAHDCGAEIGTHQAGH
jgi:REP element-mobilizing transposase RayT